MLGTPAKKSEDYDGTPLYSLLSGSPRQLVEYLNDNLSAHYDAGAMGTFVNMFYDITLFSSGRDNLCSFIQGAARAGQAMLDPTHGELQKKLHSVEENLSDGRKIFRLFKELREIYKMRRGWNRMVKGMVDEGMVSSAAMCGLFDIFAHTASAIYYFLDNVLWAVHVGILKGAQRQFVVESPGIVQSLGGVQKVVRRKNFASITRLGFALTANMILLWKEIGKVRDSKLSKDDKRLYHMLEIFSMLLSCRLLSSTLGWAPISRLHSGILAMLIAVCGMRKNWRKVLRARCGSQLYTTRRRFSSSQSIQATPSGGEN